MTKFVFDEFGFEAERTTMTTYLISLSLAGLVAIAVWDGFS
jgi:peptidoglycan biosynthesis protein MviN/MurJ (putative lipid II flippase)